MTENTNYNEAIIALKKEYEEKLALKEAENARLKSEMQSREAEEDKELLRVQAYLDEYVDVKLFKDNDRYSDDVYVAVNGQNCIIKRGEWVKIKRKFALVLEQSEIQDMRASALMASAQRISVE